MKGTLSSGDKIKVIDNYNFKATPEPLFKTISTKMETKHPKGEGNSSLNEDLSLPKEKKIAK